MDGHPALKRDPKTDPRPEPKAIAVVVVKSGRETRKERRRRQHAARQALVETASAPVSAIHPGRSRAPSSTM
jgi:hypothetical protein